MPIGVDEAIKRQVALGKPRRGATIAPDDPGYDEQSPEADMLAQDTVPVEDVPPGKAFGPGAVEGPIAPEQGALAGLGKNEQPQINSARKPNPDPYIERGLRILGELDLHNAGHTSEIEKLKSKPNALQHPDDQRDYEYHKAEFAHNQRVRSNLLRNIQGLSDSYYEKQPEQPKPEEPGMGGKIWEGTKSVLGSIGSGALSAGKQAIEHPIETARDIDYGLKRGGSIPERFIAGALPKGNAVGDWLNKRFNTEPKEEIAASHREAGMGVPTQSQLITGEKPDTTGSDVWQAVGEAGLPIGPTLKAGQMLKNIGKGALTSMGFYGAEKVANKEDITLEGLTGSGAIGATFGGVLGKLMGRGERARASFKEGKEPSAGGTGGPDTPQGTPPGAGELVPYGANRAPMQGQLEHNPPIEQGGPAPLQIEQSTAIPMGEGTSPLKQLMGPSPPALPGGVPPDAIEIPVSGFNKQFSKVWQTKDGSLIGETRGGEIVRADKQPTSPSVRDPNAPERGGLQQLLDAKRFQRDARAVQAPGAEPPPLSEQGAMPEQPFSGQPKPGLDLTAKPLPTAPQPTQPSPLQSIIPPKTAPATFTGKPPVPQAAAPQPQQVAQVQPVNSPNVLPGFGVKPQPVAQAPAPQQPSMLKSIIPGAEPKPVISEKAQPQFKPKETSAKLDTTVRPEGRSDPSYVSGKASPAKGPTKVAEGNKVDVRQWAKDNDFHVKEDGPVTKIYFSNEPGDLKITEFDTRIPGSREKAVAAMQKYVSEEGKNATKLYSGVDVGEAWEGMKKVGRYLKKEGSYFFEEGRGEKKSPIFGLKTGAANERGGGAIGQSVTEGNEAERAAHKMIEDVRYKIQPDGSYKPSKFEVGLNLPKGERIPPAKSVLDFEKINMRPGDDAGGSPYKPQYDKAMVEYNKLTPVQKDSVQGAWDFADDIKKSMNEELRTRVLVSKGRKTGLVTPKEMKEFIAELPEDERIALSSIDVGTTGTGYKRAYYPHRFEGNFEVHEIDPGTGVETGKKFLQPFEGAREGEGSSTVNTMRQARKFKAQIAEREGISPDKLKIVMPKQAGGSKYLEARKGAIGYEQEHEHVFQNYLDYGHEVAHWVQMSKLTRVVTDIINSSTLNEADKSFVINKWLPRVAGKQAAQDMFLNNLVKGVPVLRDSLDPYIPASQLLQGTRKFTTATALGVFNAASALINSDGLARHVWPQLARLSKELKLPAFSAEKYMLGATKAWLSSTAQTGITKLGEFDRTKAFASQLSKALNLNEANKNLLQKMAHEGVLDIQIFGERLPPSEKKSQAAMRGMLAMFATTEDFSRGVASVAAYRMSKDAGLSEAEALKKAFQLTSSALGRYSKAGKPMVYSSEVGGTLGIFKTYLHVMMDNAYLNMRHPVKDFGAFSRYALAAIGISGLTGLYPGTQDIDELATKAFGVSPQAWLHKNLPLWVVDGIPTLFGTDLSSRAGSPEVVPNKGEDWLGATWSKVVKPIISVAQAGYENTLHAAQGEPTSFLEDILPSLKQAAPNTVGLRYFLSESEDRLKGSRDRTIIKDLSPGEKFIKATGLPLNREVQARQQYQVGENLKSKWSEERSRLVDLYLSGDKSTKDKWSSLSQKYAITPRMIREEAKRKGRTLSERERRSLPRPLRKEYDFQEPEF